MRRAAAARALGLALAALLASPAALAEARRVEVVGVAPAGASAPEGTSARQAALEDALGRAALVVAADLLDRPVEALEAEGGREALLPRPGGSYALRFQVLEDRGERRALLLPDAEAATERALLVEVHVDAARLAADLRAAGLLAAPPPATAAGTVAVELVGVPSWRAYAGVREALEAAGAEAVRPRRFAAGRAELVVEGLTPASRLLRRLEARLPEGLRVEVEAADAQRLRLRVRDRRPAPAPAAAPAPDA